LVGTANHSIYFFISCLALFYALSCSFLVHLPSCHLAIISHLNSKSVLYHHLPIIIVIKYHLRCGLLLCTARLESSGKKSALLYLCFLNSTAVTLTTHKLWMHFCPSQQIFHGSILHSTMHYSLFSFELLYYVEHFPLLDLLVHHYNQDLISLFYSRAPKDLDRVFLDLHMRLFCLCKIGMTSQEDPQPQQQERDNSGRT
jgi:hypothetical protein